MKKVFVKDIVKETDVNDYFLVVKKGIYTTKNNKQYVSIRLRDRTGSIEGRIWDRVEELAPAFERNDLVYVESKARTFQEAVQLNVTSVHKVEKDIPMSDLGEFYPASETGIKELQAAFFELVNGIRNPHLKGLFNELEKRNGILERFFFLPASIGVHHVYIGGLLEHSVNLARMAKEMSRFIRADEDLLVAGSLLHDIGKVEEIEVKGGFGFSDKGRLLGHITIGIVMCESMAGAVAGFPDFLCDTLKHIILSHHGEAEWGSPKKPMCVEALVIHYLDNLDAKVAGVREFMQENMEDEIWTQYHKLYESRYYKVPQG
jgi:3'-5' exoribonuclease